MIKSYSKSVDLETHFSQSVQQFQYLVDTLSDKSSLGKEHGEIESWLNCEGVELLRRLLQAHFNLRTEAEAIKEKVEDSDSIVRTRIRTGVRKKLTTIFGEIEHHRVGYSARGVNTLYPMDMTLNLGSTKYSDGLRYRVSEEAAKNSFDECVESISLTTGAIVPKRQCEEIASQAAQDFESYYESTTIDERKNTNLLVITTDSKGVVMRKEDLRPATQKAAESEKRSKHRLGPGEKKNRKRMATAASVYSVDRSVRSADQIMDTEAEKPKRPKIENKRVWASVERGQKAVIGEAIDEAIGRDPKQKREWVVVVDGEVSQLDFIEEKLDASGYQATIVLDFIHVLEYLWKASYCFHEVGSEEAEQWVSERALRILEGKSSDVGAGIRRSATLQNLSQSDRTAADKCADYLQNNKPYLQYDQYLRLGYPIASGVIEGACRHLINDRLGITGARWGLKTAEAVLKIRSLRSSGNFEEYWKFHKEKELERNHISKYGEPELFIENAA